MASRCFRALRPRGTAAAAAAARQSQSRPHHSAVARLTTLDRAGNPISRDIDIRIGDPGDSYVYVMPEIGNAIRSAVGHHLGSDAAHHSDTLPLQFNHDSKHFAHASLPYPRVDILQDLGKKPERKISPATLWLSSNCHAITLDGTPDAAFERMSRESARELKGALERLKHS